MSNFSLLARCTLCPVACGANRNERAGACGVQGLKIAKYYLHPFEEPCISFGKGSGTIFFSGCNLQCPFCQNFEVSHDGRGKEITPERLADIFKELEAQGADNISFVTPAHVVPYLIRAMDIYKPNIPIVYNTGSYEKVETLRTIDPYIDIYLPDMKFYSPTLADRYLKRPDYFDIASEAIEFMSQKPLRMTEEGKMLSGTIVRHLVMPLCASDSKTIIKWFKRALPETTYLSLMSQYTPFGKIENYPELNRRVTSREYDSVVQTALDLGIERLFLQDKASATQNYIPSWDF